VISNDVAREKAPLGGAQMGWSVMQRGQLRATKLPQAFPMQTCESGSKLGTGRDPCIATQ
jgi:hypothetical protein